MILPLLLTALLQPVPLFQSAFTHLDARAWKPCLSASSRVHISLPLLNVKDAYVGRSQFLLLVKALKEKGRTQSWSLKEFEMGNPPRGMRFFHARWVFQSDAGVPVTMDCLLTTEGGESSWHLSELLCRESP